MSYALHRNNIWNIFQCVFLSSGRLHRRCACFNAESFARGCVAKVSITPGDHAGEVWWQVQKYVFIGLYTTDSKISGMLPSTQHTHTQQGFARREQSHDRLQTHLTQTQLSLVVIPTWCRPQENSHDRHIAHCGAHAHPAPWCLISGLVHPNKSPCCNTVVLLLRCLHCLETGRTGCEFVLQQTPPPLSYSCIEEGEDWGVLSNAE